MSVTSVSLFSSKIEYSVLCKYQGTNKFKTYILAPKFISSEPVKLLSHVQLFAIPWTVAYQAPPSMEFSGKNTGVGCAEMVLKNPELWTPPRPAGSEFVKADSG